MIRRFVRGVNGRVDGLLPLDPDSELDRPARPVASSCVLVLAGGAAGTAVRHLLEDGVPARPGGWPVATFAINLTGALLLGFLLESLALRGPDTGGRHRLRLLAGTGFCGGFTTYSTLALQVDRLGRAGDWATAAAYPLASLALGVLAVGGGVWLAAATARRA